MGCQVASKLIEEAGLAQYYAEREALPDRPGAPTHGWDRAPVEALPGGLWRARLSIDGLHCASCVWVTERILNCTPGVRSASVSYATGRAEVAWDPAQVDLDRIAGRVSALGYRPRPLSEAPRADNELVLKLGVAAFAAGNAMMFAVPLYLGWWQGIAERYATLFRWALLALSTPVALWSATPFYRGAWAGLRARIPHVDLPVSLGIAVLYTHGVWATLRGEEAYLDSMTMLVALLLAGRVVDQGRRRRSMEAAVQLASEAPRSARRADATGVSEVPVDALAVGDTVEVAAGEELAADGEVLAGRGWVRMALVTGEAEPVEVAAGDQVVAGGVLVEGALRVRVAALAAESLLARMAASVRDAADRPAAPTPADRIAPAFTAITLGIAVLTWGAHAALGGWTSAALSAAWKPTVAVLVVACPCALALSGPLAAAAGLGAAARRGLLLRSGEVLRRLATIDLVVLDKTGTLTGGLPEVAQADDAVLRVAAGLERNSSHPIARSIVAEASARGLAIPLGTLSREEPGVGLTGEVDGRRWSVRAAGPGQVGVWDEGGALFGTLSLRDTVRPDAARAVAALRGLGLDLVLLTGDSAEVAREVASETGLGSVSASAGPQEKVAFLEARKAEGRRVLFVGDGLNDGPALGAADVGIAMGSGAASSVLVADGVVSAAALGPVVAGLAAARCSQVAVESGLRWSVAYNALAVTGAALGLVNPLVAALLMPLSSLLVVARAARIERQTRVLLDRIPLPTGANHERHFSPLPAGPWPGGALSGALPARGAAGAV